MKVVKTALVSVSDKSNLESLATYFKENKIKVLSTGGTQKALSEWGVDVFSVSSVIDFPEVMDGRVKTLHPKIHMSLLARSSVESDMSLVKEYGLSLIDLVVVNLYPFEEKKASVKEPDDQEMSEFIDVGGPTMLRAAAKNFSRIMVLSDPKDYSIINDPQSNTLENRKKMAGKVFKKLSHYDSEISNWLLGDKASEALSSGTASDTFSDTSSDTEGRSNHHSEVLRYGENPHQTAKWTYTTQSEGLHQAKILQGKALSFNNLVDLTAAVESLAIISQAGLKTVVSVKHNNPCGVGQADQLIEALNYSLKADPKSVFGSVIACNDTLGREEAEAILDIFVECVIAPSFTAEALSLFSRKKNLRLLCWDKLFTGYMPKNDFKRVSGGMLTQDSDYVDDDVSSWKVVSGDAGSLVEKDWQQFKFANQVVSRLKSNAIAIVGHNSSLGMGMGQVNRVDSVKLAFERWSEFHKDYKGPVVLASDAFFPFPDSIEQIAKFGVKWVVQPGGSIKDNEVIDVAKKLNVGMVFTNRRHFLH